MGKRLGHQEDRNIMFTVLTAKWANPACSYAAAELVNLVNELQEVNNWIPFGLNLGIDISRLQAIEKEHPTIEERRTQLFIDWQNQVVPTWSAVVKALMAIGKRRLASEIAQKYGRYMPMEIICCLFLFDLGLMMSCMLHMCL